MDKNEAIAMSSTEEIILQAAKKVFVRKGMDGARMQEIADEAGINKALLHYYFRSKEKLFNRVFRDLFSSFLPVISETMFDPEIPLQKKIEVFVEKYITLLQENPFLPLFLAHEINKNPENPQLFLDAFKDANISPEQLFIMLHNEISDGIIEPIDPRHLLINMLSLCVFPFIGGPVISKIIFKNQEEYDGFLEERKREIPRFIYNSIRKK